MEELLKRIGRRIGERRTEMRLTQEQLAEKADLHTSYVGQMERGLRQPSLKALDKVATAFDLELYQLFIPEVDPRLDVEAVIADLPDDKKNAFTQAIREFAKLVG